MRNFRSRSLTGSLELPGVIALAILLLAGGTGPAVAQDSLPGDEAPEAMSSHLHTDGEDIVMMGDHTVGVGESVGDIVVMGGDLTVRGEIDGDAVVMGGSLMIGESGVITGDALIAGGELMENEGEIEGELRIVDEPSALAGFGEVGELEIRERVRQEVAREIENRDMNYGDAPWDIHRRSWFDDIKEGLAGVISTLSFGLVLAGIGAVLVFYGRPYLETVSDTIRGSTLRAGAVGLAVGFLVIPGFVVMVVALAVSIIGIPLLLLAVPLYPVALAAAAVMGLLGAAHAMGESTSQQRMPFDLSYRNSYAYLFTGLGMLLMPLIAGHLISMTGFLGWLGGLLQFLACVLIWAAITVGLGAVVLSRAGTRRTFVTPPGDQPLDAEPLFDDEAAGSPHA